MDRPAHPSAGLNLEWKLAAAERDAGEANAVANGLQRIIAAQDAVIARLRRENERLQPCRAAHWND